MSGLLVPAALGLLGLGCLVALALVVHRLRLARLARRRRDAEERLRPLALLLVEGDLERAPDLGPFEAAVLADLLARYARRLTGAAQDRLAAFFEQAGHVRAQLLLLRDRRAWRRASAATTLGDMGSARAVGPLIGVLDDPDREVRASAARSLGHLRASAAVAPLVDGLVGRIIPRVVVGNALLAIGSEAAPELRRLLGHDRPEIRERASELLGLVGGPVDGPALIERLRDTSAEVRAKAARALGRLGDARASEALRGALGDRVPFVRVAAAASLGVIGDRAAVRPLLRVARTDSFDPARAAARAVAQVDPRAVLRAAARSEPAPGPYLLEEADLIRMRREA